jgi:ATP-dependent protease HslVU (ClpYQ) peptidase subunit
MTTLVAIQGNGWACIGSDSRSTDESGRIIAMATPKVVQNGPYLIAGAGSARGCNILQHGWIPPKPRGDLDKFMTKSFIPAMRKTFLDAGYDIKQDSASAEHDSEFLVIIHGIIYPIFDDYSWERSTDSFYVAGSGSHYALGALKAMTYDESYMDMRLAQSMITNAVSIAIECDSASGGPIHIRTQKGVKK